MDSRLDKAGKARLRFLRSKARTMVMSHASPHRLFLHLVFDKLERKPAHALAE